MSKDGKDKERNDSEAKDKKEQVASKLNELLHTMVQRDKDQPLKETQVAQAVSHRREKKEKPLAERLAGAAKEVASTMKGDVAKTESELLNILLRRSDASDQGLEDVLKGIKVEKSTEPVSRADQVRGALSGHLRHSSESDSMSGKKRRPVKRSAAHVDILGAQPTAYFSNLNVQPAVGELRTWQSCLDRDLRLAVTHPPANIYEQLVQWTAKGVIWRFPIDNEQDLDEEKKVPFEEHIFLEEHLEGWCPEKGPIRHFMELVCVGLSKNHWLTVEEKQRHIYWYKEYFTSKKELIAELGAGVLAVEPNTDHKQLPK